MAKPTKLTKRSWIVTVLLAGASVAYVFLVFLPGQQAAAKLREELREKQQYVISAERLLIAIEDARAETAAAEGFAEQWRQRSADRHSISRVFASMMALAKEQQVVVTRFDPQPRVEMETVHQIPLVLSCEGEFSQVFAFLASIERLPTVCWMDDLSMKHIEGRMRSEVRLRIFADNPDNSD